MTGEAGDARGFAPGPHQGTSPLDPFLFGSRREDIHFSFPNGFSLLLSFLLKRKKTFSLLPLPPFLFPSFS